MEKVFSERGAAAFFYGPAEGVSSFRGSLAELMRGRGASVSTEEILVTSGSQQALDLLARTFLDPGDTVVVEEPSYLGALQVFRATRARIVSVPVDENGMRVDRLETLLARVSPKLIYTLPTFQNPSGTVMSLERRMKLLDLAYRFRVPIVEDDVYCDLWYDEPPPPPLRALDRHGYVIYASSFSKVLSPGLRVGWIAGPRPLMRRLVQAKQAMDLQAPTVSQMVIERLLSSGGYAEHIQSLREAYARRRDAMEEGLRRHARGWGEWRRPRGGFFHWCRILPPVSIEGLVAGAAEKRVSILPGSACLAEETIEGHLRLSFSFAPPEEIETGIARLARVVRRAAAQVREPQEAVGATRPVV
jgi:DNA-binding transcriptional MocR family regulator